MGGEAATLRTKKKNSNLWPLRQSPEPTSPGKTSLPKHALSPTRHVSQPVTG